jgi:hypothetical protein
MSYTKYELLALPATRWGMAQSHGFYDSLSEAQGAAAFDRLTHYAIWLGDIKVEEK